MKNIKLILFKTFGILCVVSLAFAISATLAFAAVDSYPSKPVRLIVPVAPGGGQDTITRLVATKLSERLGKQVIVDNRGGAGGVLGTEIVAKADPDGYTLLSISTAYPIQAALEKNLPYDPVKSFTPIVKLGSTPYGLSVNPSVPANSVKEFIALAKQKPGELTFGCASKGGVGHMQTERFKVMAGIDFKILHYRGAGPAIIDVLGGHTHAVISSVTGQLAHVKSGKLRILGTGGGKRLAVLPDVPTIEEAGVPGFRAAVYWGILAPAGTPTPILGRLDQELKAILDSDEIKESFLKRGAEVDYLGPTEFGKFLEEEVTSWESVAKKANIKLK